MKLLLSACFLLLLVINARVVVVECRHHPRKQDRMLFVFGDSLVDAGNRPPSATPADSSVSSRAWLYPYGISDSAHHHNATGRFSDGLVQSDLLARMLGLDESPPAYRLRQADEVDPSGVNFAMGGSGASVESDAGEPSLARQIDQFRSLVRHGIVEQGDHDGSVALIAFSGLKDYGSVSFTTSSDDLSALSAKVADAIADGVKRLLDLGVSKVVVNTLPPIGCQPFQAWNYNYQHCDAFGNTVSDTHNAALRRSLQDDDDDVLVLDVHAAFGQVVQSRYSACCADNSPTGDGYCGQHDDNGNPLYKLCPDPDNFFYWDYMHPTQAAWGAVMDNLRPTIQDFLDL